MLAGSLPSFSANLIQLDLFGNYCSYKCHTCGKEFVEMKDVCRHAKTAHKHLRKRCTVKGCKKWVENVASERLCFDHQNELITLGRTLEKFSQVLEILN